MLLPAVVKLQACEAWEQAEALLPMGCQAQIPAHCRSMGHEGGGQHAVHSLEVTALKKGIENCQGNSTIPAPCSWEQGDHCGKGLSE